MAEHAHGQRASTTDWIAVAAGSLGALMATLDISITNSALPQIQGSVGATGTEGTWISTGYLMSEIVMIPLAAWLTRVFGLRNFLIANASLFVAFSVMCGLSTSLAMLIVARIGQGFTGGAMIPTAQTIVRSRLPPNQMPLGMTIFGLIVILGPLFGPVIGGWLTENANWSWCFFINVPVCALLLSLLFFGLPRERMEPKAFFKADWLGICGLALGLSTLIVVLEEGQRERWFESDMICWLSLASFSGMLLIAASQWLSPKPILRLSLLANKSYASVILIVFSVGMALYGIAYLIPQFLALVAGYNAQQSGMVMLLSGLPAFLMMPILPRLVTRVETKLLVIGGLLLYAASCMLDTTLTARSVGSDFVWSQLIRGVGQMLCFMPLNQASMAAVSREESGDAAGLYNMARNLGGSVGLALIGTFIDRREALHDSMLRQAVHANSDFVQARIAGMTNAAGGDLHAQLLTYARLAGQIAREAMVITFNEAYFMLGIVMLLCIPLALLLKKPAPGAKLSDAAH